MKLGHEKLEAYNTALTYAALAWRIGCNLDAAHAGYGRRLTGAAHAIALNIALGNGYADPADRRRAFTSAKAAVLECTAAQDQIETCGAISASRAGMGKALLSRICAGLDGMLDDEARDAAEATQRARTTRVPITLDDEPRTIEIADIEYYR